MTRGIEGTTGLRRKALLPPFRLQRRLGGPLLPAARWRGSSVGRWSHNTAVCTAELGPMRGRREKAAQLEHRLAHGETLAGMAEIAETRLASRLASWCLVRPYDLASGWNLALLVDLGSKSWVSRITPAMITHLMNMRFWWSTRTPPQRPITALANILRGGCSIPRVANGLVLGHKT